MAATKRSYTVTFEVNGNSYTFTGEQASALVQQIQRYKNTGFPKLMELVDPDTGALQWFDFKCICEINAAVSVEDVDPRECRQIDCLPDRPYPEEEATR